MATENRPARESPAALAPAAEWGEHWWPVATAMIVVAGLHVALPAAYRIHPVWLLPAAVAALLAALIIGDRAASTVRSPGCGSPPAPSSPSSPWPTCPPPSASSWTS